MMKFTQEEIGQITEHGLSVEEAERQIALINKGVKRPELLKPARINDGIVSFNEEEKNELVGFWEENSAEINAVKFVPASGAATRMFKALNFIYHNFDEITFSEIKEKAKEKAEFMKAKEFFENLARFPFAEDIPEKLRNFTETDDLFPLMNFLMNENGLSFSNVPKGLLKFHRRGGKTLTPVEEHASEALEILKNKEEIKIHFTISPQFEERFKKHFAEILSRTENRKLNFEYSFQHPSTDTIVAVGETLLRDKNGNVVFRPGGHGALIKNLNELDADLIFIKNIDNVSRREIAIKSYEYKKLLGGYALKLAQEIKRILNALDSGNITETELSEAIKFAEKNLNIFFGETERAFQFERKKELLFEKLNKPLRVAGMVKNTGEPGGGPFWVKTENDLTNLQIVEKAQIDLSDNEQREILNASTHFNPVDLVCYVRDFKGRKFDLTKFVNPDYGIITEKHIEGKDVKVLELPGLWNAAMWDWITVFVDVPLFTFTPVKEVNDLLKPEHL